MCEYDDKGGISLLSLRTSIRLLLLERSTYWICSLLFCYISDDALSLWDRQDYAEVAGWKNISFAEEIDG